MVRRKWTRDKLDVIERLFAEGKSPEEICREMAINRPTLRLIVHRYKLRKSHNENVRKTIEKAEDLATRIRVLKGEEIRTDKPEFSFSDEQVHKWLKGVKGFAVFCMEALGVRLQPYQKDMVRAMLKCQRCCFVMGRQTGKDFTTACYVIWLCITNSNQKVLLVSPAQRQSDLLYERILTFLGANSELFASVEKSNMEQCKFRNNSVIKSLPSTTYIRGETGVTLCVMNEARDFANGEEVMASILPMLAVSKGSLVLMSSPAGCSGILWGAFNSPVFAKLQYPSSINRYIDKKWLEEQKQTLSTNYYQMEFEGQFSESIDNFFAVHTIEKCSREYDFSSFPQDGVEYFCGIDWGRVKDASVVTVVLKKGGEVKVENIIEMSNKPFSLQLAIIKALHQKYGFSRIVAEKAGLSMPLCEKLNEEGLPVKEFVPTIEGKSEAYNYFLREMESGNIIMPRNHLKLQYEMRTFRFEVMPQGRMKLHHPAGGSDDFVDSLCFAVWATKISEWRPPSEELMKKWEEFLG